MQLTVESFTVHKRVPLTISRGTTARTTNLWLRLQADGIEGWGEASPFSVLPGEKGDSAALLLKFQEIIPSLEQFSPFDRQAIESALRESQAPPSLRAAVDVALHDWLGKRVGLPLWRLWGLNRARIAPTSVTVGLNSPEGARERVRDWQRQVEAKILKVKLGSPEGIEADRAMLSAVRQEAPRAVLTVDANGGWSLAGAIEMCDWLAGQGVMSVEQPLAAGEEDQLPLLFERSPLPIFVDESCFSSQDIPRLAPAIHGINVKLMKAGGLGEAMRMVQVARACGLQVLYGCYSDSSLANTAMAHLAPLADCLDLDSHLNLRDDPFQGAVLEGSRLVPNPSPGLGVTLKERSDGRCD